jgi:hypothetical protein
VDESTFLQLEKTPWTEGPDADAGEVGGGRVSKKEKLNRTLDATQYVLGGMESNIGPYGTSKHTDPKPAKLPGKPQPHFDEDPLAHYKN